MLFLCSQQGNKGYLAIREWSIRSQINCYLALDEGPKEHKDRDPCSYDKVEEIPQGQPSHLPQCHLFDLQAQPVPLAVQLSFKANKDHLQGYRGTHTSKWQSEMLSVSLTSIEGGMGGATAGTSLHRHACMHVHMHTHTPQSHKCLFYQSPNMAGKAGNLRAGLRIRTKSPISGEIFLLHT